MTTIFSLHRAGDGFNKNIREEKLVNQGTLLELIHVIVQYFLIYICTIYLEKFIDKSKTPMTALFRAS